MEYTRLGRTGLRVSKLGLGGAPLGGAFGKTDEAEVERMIHAALDEGVNFIDTAPLYGGGESERRIGEALVGRRDQVVLATKAVRSDQRYDYKSTIQSVEQSLKLLKTDWIDVLQLHDVNSQPYELIMEEAVPALEQLKKDGKIRYTGVTDKDLPLLMRYMRTGAFDTVQFYAKYILVDHAAKDELLPLAEELDLGVIQGSVLGMGLLAGTPAGFLEAERREIADRLMTKADFLRRPGKQALIEPGMRFSLSNPAIHVSLTGTDTVAALRMNAGFCDGQGLAPEDQQRVLEIFEGESLF